MNCKLFELRDKGTFIPIIALKVEARSEPERYLLARAGYGTEQCVILVRAECSGVNRNATYDPYAWGGRTYPVAHNYIIDHFDELKSGAVVDVEHILGESTKPKLSESVESPR